MKYLVLLCSLIFFGCHHLDTPATQAALRIMGPVHLSISPASDSIRLSPELRLTNLTKSVVGIEHFGGQITIARLDYRFTDENRNEIPLLRRDFLGSTLAGIRIWTTLLSPDESVQWTPDEALVYPKVPKGRYWLVAHLEFGAPTPVADIGLSYGEKGEIDHKRQTFDSSPLEISVE